MDNIELAQQINEDIRIDDESEEAPCIKIEFVNNDILKLSKEDKYELGLALYERLKGIKTKV